MAVSQTEGEYLTLHEFYRAARQKLDANLWDYLVGGTAKDKGKNIFVLGLLARIFDLDVAKLTALVKERFGGTCNVAEVNRKFFNEATGMACIESLTASPVTKPLVVNEEVPRTNAVPYVVD